MALWMDVGPDDLLCIDGATYIAVERKSGARARLKIFGKGEVELMRKSKLRVVEHPPAVAAAQSTGD